MTTTRLVILGDLHFNTSHDYNYEAFTKFIDWFEKYDFGRYEETELVQLGDVVEKASNLGDTLELVTTFFDICVKKFQHIYIIGGNHDHKFINEQSQYATQYLKFIGAQCSHGEVAQIINVYDESIFFTKNRWQIIALPYKRVDGKILDDYYSNELDKSFYTTKADLLCGHVAIKEPKTFYGGIDISKFSTEHKAFGHIHTRNGHFKDYYVGSVMPFKIDEAHSELKRAVKVLEKDAKGITETEIIMPEFIKYEAVQFDNTPLFKKNSDNQVHIYTVSNCKNLQQARNFYPDYYIRGVEKVVNNTTVSSGQKEQIFVTPLDALSEMMRETKMTIKRKTMALLKAILS